MEPRSFEIAGNVNLSFGIFHIIRTEFDFDAVFPENVWHVESGDTSQSGGFPEADFVTFVQVDSCCETSILVLVKVISERMANGIALVFENPGVDAPFDELVEIVRESASGSWHCPHTMYALIQYMSFDDPCHGQIFLRWSLPLTHEVSVTI
jgi:hypothetical protein